MALTNARVVSEIHDHGAGERGVYWLEANRPALTAIRVKEGLSQRELAKKCKVHYSMISRIEKGERNPSPKLGKQIAKVLQVPEEAIFFGHYVEDAQQS